MANPEPTQASAAVASPNPQRREPLSDVLNSPPLLPKSIWTRKDSSEKTPSTVASDDAAYIFPAVVVSSSTLADEGDHPPTSPLRIATTPAAPPPDNNWVGTGSSRGSRGSSRSSSGPRHHRVTLSENQDENAYQTPSPPPPAQLRPLEPLYPPPHRAPTPAGLPSYEASQRAASARETVRQIEQCLGLRPGVADQQEQQAQQQPRRRCCYFRRGGGADAEQPPSHLAGYDGSVHRDAPLWRPPQSQHALAPHHPYLQPGLRNNNNWHRHGDAAADAEAEARGGRAARRVRLEDYDFLRGLTTQQQQPGGGGDGNGGGEGAGEAGHGGHGHDG